MPIMILVCEVCEARIGTFDSDTLCLPIAPDLFGPLEAGFSPPFQPEMDWEHMFCPICGKRAMGWDDHAPNGVRQDRLLSPEGYWIVPVEPVVPVEYEDVPVPEPTVVADPNHEAFPTSMDDGAEQPAPTVPPLSMTTNPFPRRRKAVARGK